MLTGGGMRSRNTCSWAWGVSLTGTFTKLCPSSVSLQKAPFMLEDLPGKGATFPNPEEGRSSSFQTKEAELGNAAVPAAIAREPTRLPLRRFPWKTRHSHSSFWGLQRAPGASLRWAHPVWGLLQEMGASLGLYTKRMGRGHRRDARNCHKGRKQVWREPSDSQVNEQLPELKHN